MFLQQPTRILKIRVVSQKGRDMRMEANKTGNIRTTYKIRRVRKTTVAVKKQWVLHTCLCVLVSVRVDLFIQHATRMRYAVSSAASLAPLYFSTLSHKRHNFRKKSY